MNFLPEDNKNKLHTSALRQSHFGKKLWPKKLKAIFHHETIFVCQLFNFDVSNWKIFRFLPLFLHGKQIFFYKCEALTEAAFAGSLWRCSFKTSKPSKNVHPKLPVALCGIIQVFFIMSYAQYFQNSFTLTRKLLNHTSNPMFCVACCRFFKCRWTLTWVSVVKEDLNYITWSCWKFLDGHF